MLQYGSAFLVKYQFNSLSNKCFIQSKSLHSGCKDRTIRAKNQILFGFFRDAAYLRPQFGVKVTSISPKYQINIYLFCKTHSFLSSLKEKKQKKGAKTSCLGGRMSDYRNHSMNSLRSNSISCRFACLAIAIQESKKIPIIVHPLKTSSCGMFSSIILSPRTFDGPRVP